MKNYKTILAAALLLAVLSKPVLADSLTLSIGTPPPPAVVEAVPVAPGPDEEYMWHPGHWRWIDERYVWIPGHWAHRPYPQAIWVVPGWEHDHDSYRFHEGHWQEHEEHEEREEHHDHGHGHGDHDR